MSPTFRKEAAGAVGEMLSQEPMCCQTTLDREAQTGRQWKADLPSVAEIVVPATALESACPRHVQVQW